MEQVPSHLRRVKDLTNMVFGSLRTTRPVGQTTKNQIWWECICDCGKIVIVASQSLRRGHTQSCGCLRLRQLRASITTHGHATAARSLTYTSWQILIQRCQNPKNPAYPNYGGAGITVCERWQVFENFLADMGERASELYSIDRIDNSGNYEPGNCRWATKKQQQRNRQGNHFITAFGETCTIAEWAERSQLAFSTISNRLRTGWAQI